MRSLTIVTLVAMLLGCNSKGAPPETDGDAAQVHTRARLLPPHREELPLCVRVAAWAPSRTPCLEAGVP